MTSQKQSDMPTGTEKNKKIFLSLLWIKMAFITNLKISNDDGKLNACTDIFCYVPIV